MQIKLLKDIVSSVGGNSSVGIVDLLYDKKNVNEFLIAKKLKMTINQTRNVLYRLADEGIVSFVRKKDSRKGGWYTYFWTLNSGKSFIKFKYILLKNIAQLNSQINLKKAGRFYSCANCHVELNEENALIHEYTCPECGETLNLKDNTAEVSSLEKDVGKLKNVLQQVDVEIGEFTKREELLKNRRFKAEVKKKKTERAERIKIRQRQKKRELKKMGKKSKPKKQKKKSKKISRKKKRR